jgi:hypothetical protein
MKIAAMPRATARSKAPGLARSGESLASIGRPGFMSWSSPGGVAPNLRVHRRGGASEARRASCDSSSLRTTFGSPVAVRPKDSWASWEE